MTFDNELILIEYKKEIVSPGISEATKVSETNVLCNVKSVTQTEFWKGKQSSDNPERVFIIHSYEYNGEKIVNYDGKEYSVIRTYEKDFEELELICEQKLGVGDNGT